LGRIVKGNEQFASEDIRKGISEKMKGEGNYFYGREHSEETKQKIREHHPHLNMRGEKHFNWKGGVWQTIRRMALRRDDYTCQRCGLREPSIMVVDHIKPKSIFPELLLVLENLEVLCPNDHARKSVLDEKQYNVSSIKKKQKKLIYARNNS